MSRDNGQHVRNLLAQVKNLGLTRLFSPNVYVQILTLLSGLLVAFLFPVMFGLAAYGELLRAILPTLVLHRIIDSMSEALIPQLSGDEIFVSALVAGGATAFLGTGIFHLAGGQGPDVLLLAVMILTSVASLGCYKNNMTWELVVFLLVFCGLFCALSLARSLGAPITLRMILVITNAVGALVSIGMLAWRRVLLPRNRSVWPHFWSGVHRIPQSLSSTLMMNTITIGYLWLAAPAMTSVAVAQLRVLTSVVQASISVFPVGLKAIFVRLTATTGKPLDFFQLLSAALWFFLLVFFGLQGVSIAIPAVGPLGDLFLVAIPFFWAACMERFAQASGGRTLYRAVNVVLCPLTLLVAHYASIQSLAVIGYVAAICAYCIVLAATSLRRRGLVVILLALVVGAATVSILYNAVSPWIAGLLVVAVAAVITPPRLELLRYYRGHI